MINKISNLKLVLGLVLLGLVYLATVFFDSNKSEELERQLVTIDTAQVTGITIISPNETVELSRESQAWQVQLATGKKVPAVTSKVKSLLTELQSISPDRLAAKEKNKWSDYQVDSTGTIVKVTEAGSQTLNMVVGQLGTTSYLRLADQQEVYASDSFSGLKNSSSVNNFRDNTFLKLATDSIKSIAFNYPADSSFRIEHTSNGWQFADGSLADSARIVDYIRKLGLKSNDAFSDQDGNSLGELLAEIIVSTGNEVGLSIKAYSDPTDSVVYQSSSNPTSYFNDDELGDLFFVGKSSLSTGD